MSPNKKGPLKSKEWYDIKSYFQNYRAKVKADYRTLRSKNLPLNIYFLKPEVYKIFFKAGKSGSFSDDEILMGLELVSRYIINEHVLHKNNTTETKIPIKIKGDSFLTMVICLLMGRKFVKRKKEINNRVVKYFMEKMGRHVTLITIKKLEAEIFKKLDYHVDIPMIHTHCQALFEFIGGSKYGIGCWEFHRDCMHLVKLFYSNIDKMLTFLLKNCLNKEILSAGILCTILFKNNYRHVHDACVKLESAIDIRKEEFLKVTVVLIRTILGDESVEMNDIA